MLFLCWLPEVIDRILNQQKKNKMFSKINKGRSWFSDSPLIIVVLFEG